jgi:hypothetical protein
LTPITALGPSLYGSPNLLEDYELREKFESNLLECEGRKTSAHKCNLGMTFNDFAGKLLDSSKVDWKFIEISLKGITWMQILIFFVSISAGLGRRLFKHNEASLSVLKISSIDFGFLSNWSRLTECLFKICILFFHISGSPFDESKFSMYLGLKKKIMSCFIYIGDM